MGKISEKFDSYDSLTVSLFPGGYASVDFWDEPPVKHFEEDHSGSGIHHLLDGGPVGFVFDPDPLFVLFPGTLQYCAHLSPTQLPVVA